ncbi:pilus assembly protein CpaE [Rhodobacter aestuarii]|uniref:Pilus assembly protein CpaE n=1 Tax=Rhodobacter aestuarii TaxID=453582 RepID=A0A1N7N656_9RHOB|nr:AAA family ATPase [Rhodobacter aestuarii]PTV96261.1 pilus assembly protein CpaE [Rhodobacter aestuarii]SIS93877.1 pilus assembly protein CpaE [Rhodobacter aestuarii]
MSAAAILSPEPAPIVACTVSRDVSNFDLLIEDMEAELGESWGDLTFEDAVIFLNQPDSESLEFIAIAVDSDDEGDLGRISGIITSAKEKGIRVILIAEEVSPIALHQLLRLGADDFVPYPLPEGALHEAVERLGQPAAEPTESDQPEHAAPPTMKASGGGRDGVVLPVHGLSGGAGATTFAVNLAWELANPEQSKKNPVTPPRVCLLDFDFQFGSASTYLDLPRRDLVFELLQDTSSMDSESFNQALLSFNDRLQVLTAPPEMLPLDIVTGEDISRLIEMARTNFDFVVIDMPSTVISWTETVLNAAHLYFALIELDMRSAQNTLRMIRALKAENLPAEKLRYVLNRAPKFTDLNGKSRVKRLAESLDISLEVLLSDAGRVVTQANDHGLPLALSAAKSPLRKEIQKLAQSIADLNRAAEAATA